MSEKIKDWAWLASAIAIGGAVALLTDWFVRTLIILGLELMARGFTIPA